MIAHEQPAPAVHGPVREVHEPPASAVHAPARGTVHDSMHEVVHENASVGTARPCVGTGTTGYLDTVFGARTGYVATAFGIEPYRDDHGRYRHRRWEERRYLWPDRRAELVDLLARVASGASGSVDAYVCPLLRLTDARNGFGGRRGSNAAPADVLYADFDADDVLDTAKLAGLDAYVVGSGQRGHLHVYVLLDQPVPVVVHRALNTALTAHLGADAKFSDDTLLRAPGTWNWKPAVPMPGTQPSAPAPVVVIKPSARRWAVADIAGVLGVDLHELDKTRRGKPGKRAGASRADLTPQDPPNPLPGWVQFWLDSRETDRSVAHARLVAACIDAGLTVGQTVSVCAGFAPSVDKYGDRLPWEVARCWDKFSGSRTDTPRPAASRVSGSLAGRLDTPPATAPGTRPVMTGRRPGSAPVVLRKVLTAPKADRSRLLVWAARVLFSGTVTGVDAATAASLIRRTATSAGLSAAEAHTAIQIGQQRGRAPAA